MLKLPARPRSLVPVTTFLLLAGCADQATAPLARDIEARNDVVLPSAYVIDTGPGGTSSIGSSAMFASGATNCSPQPACAAHFQFLGGKFTLASRTNVESVEGWMSVGFAGNLDVHIRSDSTPPAGAHIPGHSLHTAAYAVGTQAYGWKVFSSFSVSLPPGTYWLTFEPVANGGFSGGMTGTAASPLADYAFFADGNNRWVPFSAFSQQPAFGMRVYGAVVRTTSDLISALQIYVAGSGIPRPNARKIDQKLQLALSAVGAGQTATACTYMQDVIDYTAAQSVRKIPASVSSEILSQARAIQDDLGC
jgi:hypothetical protein